MRTVLGRLNFRIGGLIPVGGMNVTMSGEVDPSSKESYCLSIECIYLLLAW
jgi:hypothetical protein